MQYENDEILQHSIEGGFNKFLVSWKGYNALTSAASFVFEAELRRIELSHGQATAATSRSHTVQWDRGNSWAAGPPQQPQL
jgi:hypothetical protein